MSTPTIDPLPALPTFPTGPGLPDQPGVFIPQFLAFLNALRTFSTQANDVAAYLETLSGGGGSGGTSAVATRTALAALAATSGMVVYLTEAGREGPFVFSTASTDATLALGDTLQGVYVAASGGTWVRKFTGPHNIRWFGATGDGVTNDSAAFLAALVYLKSISQIPYVGWIARGAPKLFVPLGIYKMGTTTLDIDFTLIVEGEGTLVGYGSRLKWTGDCTGIRIQSYNTDGGSGATGTGTTGTYTTIRNLGLFGPYEDTTDFTGNTEGEYHGVHARANYIIEDCRIEGFAGDGLHVLTSSGAGGAEEGNSNCSMVSRLRVMAVRNGVFIDGADANAGTYIGVIGTYCRQHTVWDSSFLGNTHIGHHSSGAGLVNGVPPGQVSSGGNRYFVKQGQAVGASTNAPSGTTADNTWWLYNGAGAPDTGINIPAWVSGTTYREAGSYCVDSLNNYGNWIGFYVEGGEASPQFMSPAVNIVGGLVGGARDLVTSGQWLGSRGFMAGGTAVVGTRQLGWVAATGSAYRGTWDPSTVSLNTLAQVVKALFEDLGTSASGHGLLDS